MPNFASTLIQLQCYGHSFLFFPVLTSSPLTLSNLPHHSHRVSEVKRRINKRVCEIVEKGNWQNRRPILTRSSTPRDPWGIPTGYAPSSLWLLATTKGQGGQSLQEAVALYPDCHRDTMKIYAYTPSFWKLRCPTDE